MATGDNGRLFSSFGINFEFEASDKVTKIVNRIEKELNKLDESARGAGSIIDNLFNSFEGNLRKFSSQLESVRILSDDFFKSPDTASFKSAVSSAKTALKTYEDTLRNLLDLQNEISSSGGSTKGIDKAIANLAKEYDNLGETLRQVVLYRVGSLVDEFNACTDAAEKDRIKMEAVNEMVNELGTNTDDATKAFDDLVQALNDAGQSYSEFIEQQEKSQSSGKGFKNLISGIGKILSGKGGLTGILSAATGVIGGFVGAIASTALKVGIQLLNKLIRKGIQELGAWIKSWGEVKRSIREGMGAAASDSLSQLRRLDELKEKLEGAEKGTAEYANARKEIISKYGQYNRYLQEEIDRVGDLSTAYDQLRVSIVEASLERQRQKAQEKNDERSSKKVAKSFSRLYRKSVRRYGAEAGAEIYDEVYNALLNGTEVTSEEAASIIGTGRYRQASRRLRRWQKRSNKINEGMRNNAGENNVDYTIQQEEYARLRDSERLLKESKDRENQIRLDAQQRAVDIMADGFSKQRAQAKLDYQRSLQQVEDWKNRYVLEMEDARKAAWVAAGNPLEQWNPYSKDNMLAKKKDSQFAETTGQKMIEDYEKLMKRMIADISFQEQQQMAANYGTFEQKKEATSSKWRRELAQVPSKYKGRALSMREYEFAQMDYETIQKYGTQDQIRKALEKMLDAEIQTLDEAERRAAQARKRVTLAEFDSGLAETYGGRQEQRAALEAKLQAELDTIDEKYREIQAASNRVTLAEFDVQTAEKYGTRDERRKALNDLLEAQKNEYLKKNGSGASGRIDAQNAYELAKFDWEEIADFGSYEAMLKALRAKWKAQIELLPEDLREGATRKMNKEILELEIANSDEYKRIFAEADSMTKSTLNNTIKFAESLLQAKINAGASVDEVKALRDQIDNLRTASDAIDFSGWGGTLQGLIQTRNRRNQSRSTLATLLQQQASMRNRAKSLSDPTGSSIMNSQEWKDLSQQIRNATDASEKWDAELKKQAAALISTNLGGLLTQIGDALSQIAEISGDSTMARIAEGFSEIGNTVSTIAQGFASGGLWGGIATAATTLASKVIEAVTSVSVANAKYEKFLKDFEKELKMLELEVNETDFSNAFGVDNYGMFVSAYDKMTEAMKRFVEESQEVGTMNIKTHDYSWWANAFISDKYAGLKDFDIWGDDGLLDITKAKAFLNASTQITDAQRTEIENAIELKQQYEDLLSITENFISSLTGSVVDSLANDMVESFLDTGKAIIDADKYLQDFNKNLATSIVKSMLLNQVFTEDAQNEIAKLLATGDTTSAIEKYNELLNQANEMAPQIEDFLRQAGVSDIHTQSATAGGFQTMSQDVANELNGRFAALQIAGENILIESRGIHADTTDIKGIAGDIQNLALISMGHLEDIALYTSYLPGMEVRLQNIEKYSKQMVS